MNIQQNSYRKTRLFDFISANPAAATASNRTELNRALLNNEVIIHRPVQSPLISIQIGQGEEHELKQDASIKAIGDVSYIYDLCCDADLHF